jgi:hypothetical protein
MQKGYNTASQRSLSARQPSEVSVPANRFERTTLHGNGFTLTLNLAWTIQPGPRKGDLSVKQTAKGTS